MRLARPRGARHGKQRQGAKDAWQKVKIDRQIIAIARVHNAQVLLTEDGDLKTSALRVGLAVQSVSDLPIPADALQRALDLKRTER